MSRKGPAVDSRMKPRDAINKLARRKNTAYYRWLSEHSYEDIFEWCVECLLIFGTLPYWVEYSRAARVQDWQRQQVYSDAQRDWKNEIRNWAMAKGIIRYPNQFAQFYKFYAAWYRYKWEKEHGKIERQYARQMY